MKDQLSLWSRETSDDGKINELRCCYCNIQVVARSCGSAEVQGWYMKDRSGRAVIVKHYNHISSLTIMRREEEDKNDMEEEEEM